MGFKILASLLILTATISGCKADLAVATSTRSAAAEAQAPSFTASAAPSIGAADPSALMLSWPDVDGAVSYVVKTSSDPSSKDCGTGTLSSTNINNTNATVVVAHAAAVCIVAVNQAGTVVASSYYPLTTTASPAATAPVVVDQPIGALAFSSAPRALTAGTMPLNPVRIEIEGATAANLATHPVLTLAAASDKACQTLLPSAVFKPLTAVANQGVATFASFAVTKAGTVYLKATGPALTATCSPALVIAAAGPAQILATGTLSVPFAGHVQPIALQVVDAYRNPVAKVPLTLTVQAGGGSCASCSGSTDSTGSLAAGWTIGPVEATSNSLTVTTAGLPPLTLTATSLNFYCDQAAVSGAFQAGSGTASDPWILCTAAQLAHIGTDPTLWTQSFRLERDLDLASYDASTVAKKILPIGQLDQASPGTAVAYTGTFDGNGHSLNHFTVGAGAGTTMVGLFGNTSGATVKNLTVANAVVNSDGSAFAAILIGNGLNTTVDQVVIGGSLAAPNGYGQGAFFGTMAASAGNSSITNSSTTATINGSDRVGGLVGVLTSDTGGIVTLSQIQDNATVGQAGDGNTYGGVAGELAVTTGGHVSLSHIVSNASVTVPLSGGFSGGFGGTFTASGTGSTLSITDCLQTGNFTSALHFIFFYGVGGGFVGILSSRDGALITVARSGVTGNVRVTNTGGTAQVGGFIGALSTTTGNGASLSITDSYSTGSVTIDSATGAAGVGTFVGDVQMEVVASETITLTRNYASGALIGVAANTPGGLVGTGLSTPNLTFTDCYWNSDNFAQGFGQQGVTAGITGESLANLKLTSTYPAWNFTSIWRANAGALPSLR